VSKKSHDFLSGDRLLKDTHVELACSGNSADDRKVVIVERSPEHRGLSARSIRSNRGGKLIKTGLVDEHHGSIVSLGFF